MATPSHFFLINKNHFSNQNRVSLSSGKRIEPKCGVHIFSFKKYICFIRICFCCFQLILHFFRITKKINYIIMMKNKILQIKIILKNIENKLRFSNRFSIKHKRISFKSVPKCRFQHLLIH